MTKDDFWQGVRGGFPVMVSASPFGALFGALAVDNGFSVFDAVFMSATVYAGASQMVGIELFGHNVQPWLIILSIFAVNFRHILYSASIARHIRHFSGLQKFLAFFLLVDPQYAETEKRAERGEPVTFAWYLGFGMIIYLPWQLMTLLGAIFGQMIGDPKGHRSRCAPPDLFHGTGSRFSQARQLVAGRRGQFAGLNCSHACRRLAMACQHRRYRRYRPCRLHAAVKTA